MEPEKIAYELFTDALPHYFDTYDEYPDDIKFRLALNGYGSCWEACLDIANHVLTTPKLKKNNIDEIDEYEHKDELKYYGMKVFSDTRKLYNTLNALDYFLSNDTCEETFIERCKEVYGDMPKDGEL